MSIIQFDALNCFELRFLQSDYLVFSRFVRDFWLNIEFGNREWFGLDYKHHQKFQEARDFFSQPLSLFKLYDKQRHNVSHFVSHSGNVKRKLVCDKFMGNNFTLLHDTPQKNFLSRSSFGEKSAIPICQFHTRSCPDQFKSILTMIPCKPFIHAL